MNICFFCGGFNTNGGIGRVTSIIAEKLATKHNVYLCSLYENKTDSYYDTTLSKDNYCLFESPVSMNKAMLKGHAISQLKEYLKEKNIDVVVACGALYFPLVVIAARLCGIKVMCWEHISPTVTTDYKFQKEARWFGTRFCDCNIVLTKESEKWYAEHYKYKKLIQIYNPVDPAVLSTKTSGYNAQSKKIISVGRLSYQKNFERLLEIAKEVLAHNPDWTWDIYGEGERRLTLENKINEYGLNGKVSLRGQVQNIYSLYDNYAMIVMTSRYEGFPMVLLEAAAFGLPMIAFDIQTGPKEIINNGVNGFLCDNSSDFEMINAIATLMNSQDKRVCFSQESKKTADLFSIDKIAAQWDEKITELLNG